MWKYIVIALVVLMCGTPATAQSQLHENLALKYLVHMPPVMNDKTPVIILLHGYNSNEQDLFALWADLPENFLVISARAPNAIFPNGYAWYDLGGDGNPEAHDDQRKSSADLIRKFIKQIMVTYHANPARVYLAGFSQGAIMSYEVGLTTAGVYGIAVLSGMMTPSLLNTYMPSTGNRPKIFIAHGTKDNRIPFESGKQSADYLKDKGLDPQFHEYPGMGHTINQNVISDFRNWLHNS